MILPERMDPDINEAAEEALTATLAREGMNEWRALFVTLRMVWLLMERTGCKVPIAVTFCQCVREMAGEAEMERVEATRRKAFAAKRLAKEARTEAAYGTHGTR